MALNTGKKLSMTKTEQERKQRQLQRYMEMLRNKQIVDEYNRQILTITGAHHKSDTAIDWERLYRLPAPYEPAAMGPKETAARQRFDAFAPRWYERWMLRSLADRRKAALLSAVEQAAEEDRRDYELWSAQHELAGNVLQGDVDAYFQVIADQRPLDDLLQLGSDFEFGANDGTGLEVEFRAFSSTVVPKEELSLTKTGKLSRKEMSKSKHHKLMQDYVCSCALRIARDMMALLPVKKVTVHAVDQLLNTATGHWEEATVLSVSFDRGPFLALNFDALDPSEAVQQFPCRMAFTATGGFKPVKRIGE